MTIAELTRSVCYRLGPMFVPQRHQTVSVPVGPVSVGSCHPVVVQSMTNTDTADPESTAQQVAELFHAGSELVRITVNNQEAAAAVPEIQTRLHDLGVDVPLIGDFHYNGHVLLEKYPRCAEILAKYRINPGNVGKGANHDKNFATMVQCAVDHKKPVRIGVNAGSLDQDLLNDLMETNAKSSIPRDAQTVFLEAMVQSAIRSASFTVGRYTCRISTRPLTSGGSTWICRSKRPGRSSAA